MSEYSDNKYINGGGPAFPVPVALTPEGDAIHSHYPGMLLRDYFAAKAMQAIYAGPGAQVVADRDQRYDEAKGNWGEVVAANAYEMADTMLVERGTPNTELTEALKRATDAELALKTLRPVWATGFTKDSVAAQGYSIALATLWKMLGVTDQTQAVARLRYLLANTS